MIYILLDDVGFADLGCYGSEIQTPNIDRLAATGLRYNNFHTRRHLLADAGRTLDRPQLARGGPAHGRQSRQRLPERTWQDHAPGGDGGRDPQDGGVQHVSGRQVASRSLERDLAGRPLRQLAARRGFERFFGFLDGMTDQIHPELVQDQTRIEPPTRPGYHLTEDLIDHAIADVRNQTAVTPEKPFFLYVALGAAHSPHQVAKAYLDKYVPLFQKGWDQVRDGRLARQKQLGIVPRETELSARNDGVRPWDGLSQRRENTLRSASGRVRRIPRPCRQPDRPADALSGRDRPARQHDHRPVLGQRRQPGGGPRGKLERARLVQRTQRAPHGRRDQAPGRHRDRSQFHELPTRLGHGRQHAVQAYKQNLHGGGANDPLIIAWPRGIADRGAIRTQFVDVIDITPTILDVTGIAAPKTFHGVDANAAPWCEHRQYVS